MSRRLGIDDESSEGEGSLRCSLTRKQLLQRTAVTAGAVAGSSLLPPWMSIAADAATTNRATAAAGVPYTHFKQFKPFNPNVPAGPPTGLPKAIASNFGAGSAYFIEFAN